MSLFEFADGQFKPAELGKPADPETLTAMLRVIRSHVLELLSRPLFPVVWLSNRDEPPRLIAVDSSGQVVCIYVVEHLGSDQMVSVLAKLNETRSFGWNELSELYEGGQAAFRAGVTAFRSKVPAGAPSGPRLIVVAATVEDTLRSAIEVLVSSGIEVHEFSLRELANGHKILHLEPVTPSLWGYSQRIMGRNRRPLPLRSRRFKNSANTEVYPLVGQITHSPESLAQALPSVSSQTPEGDYNVPAQSDSEANAEESVVTVEAESTVEAEESVVTVEAERTAETGQQAATPESVTESAADSSADSTAEHDSAVRIAQTAFNRRHAGRTPVARPRIIPKRRPTADPYSAPANSAPSATSTSSATSAPSTLAADAASGRGFENTETETPRTDFLAPYTSDSQRFSRRGEVLRHRGCIPSRRALHEDAPEEPLPETTVIAVPRDEPPVARYTAHGTPIPSRRRRNN